MPAGLSEAHFPSRLHQFVWRNWELANLERMAQTVEAEPAQLQAIAEVELYRRRERLEKPGADRERAVQRMREIIDDEATLAKEQFHTAREHSVLAYEASNHYFYRPLDLAEKVLNCKWAAAALERRAQAEVPPQK